MSNYDKQNINVLNYNESAIFADTAKEHYKFSASRDGKIPSIVPMPLSELQYLASNTEGILTGWLTFDEDVKPEIYKDLRIPNWENILTNDDITEILLHPTLDGLQKIVDIENVTYFDRVRMIMFKLMQSGNDVTTKVSRIVDQRYRELQGKKRITDIILRQKDTVSVSNETVNELSAQNAALQTQLDEMKKMMEQLMNSQKSSIYDVASETKSKVEAESEVEAVERPKKKPGRPSTKKTV